MSWAQTCLKLSNGSQLPLTIDKTTFMPLMTCFHDTDKAMESLVNPCVTDELNPSSHPNRSYCQGFITSQAI